MTTFECKWCNGQFQPRKRKYCTYCTRECYFKAKSFRRLMRRAQRRFQKAVKARIPAKPRSSRPSPQPPQVKWCAMCGLEMQGSRHRRCATCRKVLNAACRKRHKRIGKATRRARKMEAEAERFDPYIVFNRDGWACRQCHIPVKGNWDATDPRSAELDHIIPLSRGGAHTQANTQCLCRGCNMKKGAKLAPAKTAEGSNCGECTPTGNRPTTPTSGDEIPKAFFPVIQ